MSNPTPASSSTPPVERQEHREHPRFKVEGATAILGKQGLLAGIGLGVKKDIVVNLSQGGVLVLAPKRFEPGLRLPLRIEIPKWKDLIQAEAVVCWCAQSARTETHFYAGLRFAGLNPLDAKRIAQMYELINSVEYRAKSAVRKDSSSGRFQAPKP